jgi:poly(beta-D-mannuronate) lyase
MATVTREIMLISSKLTPLWSVSLLLALVWVLSASCVRPKTALAASSPTEPSIERYTANAARVVRVSHTTELTAAIQDLAPGDVVILADGVYAGDATLRIADQSATSQQPIVITAEHQRQAVLQGTLHFEISNSSHVTICGLTFNTQGAGKHRDIGAITIKHSHHNRITHNRFALAEQLGAHPEVMLDWLVIRGKQSRHNRVDHNLFENKLQRGRFIIVGLLDAADTMPQYTHIDHNHFRDMAPLARNGMEAVVLGGGHPVTAFYMADQDAFSMFEYNLLERVDGECAEVISLKSSSNVIRHNTFLDTNGSIYFRAGNRNTVYGNYFLGCGKKGSGGVRIYGEEQKVSDNYFSGLDIPAVWFGDANAVTFDPDKNLAPFTQVTRAEVANNIFVDTNLGLARHLRPGCDLRPRNSVIRNNLLYSNAAHRLVDPLLLAEKGITWQGNIAYAKQSSRAEQLGDMGLSEEAIHWEEPQVIRYILFPNNMSGVSTAYVLNYLAERKG